MAFPLVSRIGGGSASRNRLFLASLGIVTVVGIAYALFIFRFGHSLISLTVGTEWLGALMPIHLSACMASRADC